MPLSKARDRARKQAESAVRKSPGRQPRTTEAEKRQIRKTRREFLANVTDLKRRLRGVEGDAALPSRPPAPFNTRSARWLKEYNAYLLARGYAVQEFIAEDGRPAHRFVCLTERAKELQARALLDVDTGEVLGAIAWGDAQHGGRTPLAGEKP